jgi:8-oxo-dGTP pyrophosphatase MutT (NUDIX family)
MSGSPLIKLAADEMVARLRTTIAARERVDIADTAARRAAVLVPLVASDDGLGILLCLRTADVWDHKSEVCFPGGSIEQRDDGPVEAALRELHEELGIDRSSVETLGLLDDVAINVSGYVITPVLGYLPVVPPLNPDPSEVERAFIVPLEYLLQPDIEQTEITEIAGVAKPRYFYSFDAMRIWGATGRIVHALLDVLRADRLKEIVE